MAFDFPGNVRQLENICHWLTVMAPAQVIEPKDLPPELMAGDVARLPVAAPLHTLAPEAMASAAPQPTNGAAVAQASPPAGMVVGGLPSGWLLDLQREARRLLESGDPEVWDTLTRQFEGQLIHTALEITRGRRIEAAHKLGIGRNTITRKIQELGLDD
jgi:two-component system nitrogen regulation response regulator GlnG